MPTYRDIIQTAGKELTKKLYRKLPGSNVYLDDEIFKSAIVKFNGSVFDGTICHSMELKTTTDLTTGSNTQYPICLEINATYGEDTQTKTYGPFYLKEKPTYDVATKLYTHKYYDEMLLTMVPYEPLNVVYPISVNNYFSALLTQLNLTSSITLDITGLKTLNEDLYYGIDENNNPISIGYTYRDVLNDILKSNGLCAKINNGVLTETPLGTTPITLNDDVLRNVNIDINKRFYPINCLTLARASKVDNLSYQDNVSIANYGRHEVILADNQILNGSDREDYIQALYNKYSGKGWYFYDLELTGFGGFDFFEQINISTNGNTYSSYVFNNEITIDEGYREVIYCSEEEQNIQDGAYRYTSNNEKADKNAEIIINKKIGEVDIRGKTINLTADKIKIESSNFNVDQEGNLKCNKAEMKGATFTGGEVVLYEDADGGMPYPFKIYENDRETTLVVNTDYDIYRIEFDYPISGYISDFTNLGRHAFLKFENDDYEIQYRYSHSLDLEIIDEVRVNKNDGSITYRDLWINNEGTITKHLKPNIIDQEMTCTRYSYGGDYDDVLDIMECVLKTTRGSVKASADSLEANDIIANNNLYEGNQSIITATPSSDISFTSTSMTSVPLVSQTKIGNKLAIDNGSIKVVSNNVEYVMVSGKIQFNTLNNSTGLRYIQIYKNSTNIISTRLYVYSGNTGAFVIIPPQLIPVQYGDKISMFSQGLVGDTVRSTAVWSYLTVEALNYKTL